MISSTPFEGIKTNRFQFPSLYQQNAYGYERGFCGKNDDIDIEFEENVALLTQQSLVSSLCNVTVGMTVMSPLPQNQQTNHLSLVSPFKHTESSSVSKSMSSPQKVQKSQQIELRHQMMQQEVDEKQDCQVSLQPECASAASVAENDLNTKKLRVDYYSSHHQSLISQCLPMVQFFSQLKQDLSHRSTTVDDGQTKVADCQSGDELATSAVSSEVLSIEIIPDAAPIAQLARKKVKPVPQSIKLCRWDSTGRFPRSRSSCDVAMYTPNQPNQTRKYLDFSLTSSPEKTTQRLENHLMSATSVSSRKQNATWGKDPTSPVGAPPLSTTQNPRPNAWPRHWLMENLSNEGCNSPTPSRSRSLLPFDSVHYNTGTSPVFPRISDSTSNGGLPTANIRRRDSAPTLPRRR